MFFFSEMIFGKQKAFHVRQIAEKDKNGRLQHNMNHLKSLVEKARKEKHQKLIKACESKNNKRERMGRKHSSVLSIVFPVELKEALEKSEQFQE